jgi:hypothetical protein
MLWCLAVFSLVASGSSSQPQFLEQVRSIILQTCCELIIYKHPELVLRL